MPGSQFQSLFEQAPISVQILSLEGKTIYINAAWKKLWGADPSMVDFVLTRYNMLEDPQLEAQGVMPYIKKAFLGDQVIVPPIYYDPGEVELKGRGRWVEGYFYPVIDPSEGKNGQIQNVILMHNDITDRKLAEMALEQSEAREKAARIEAEKALELRSEFLSTASHELRTPLTSLSMQIQMIRRLLGEGSPKKITDLLVRAEHQIKRFARLIENLLDVSKINHEKLSLDLENVDLSALLTDVVEWFRLELEKNHCDVELNASAPVLARVDRAKIEQVVINLLSNAMKFGPGKPISIRVWAEGPHACFSIQDRGAGIAPEDQERIFLRFERAASITRFGGLGLGLFIVHQIVKAHGGDIELKSALGKGATFTVRLPLQHET